LGEFEIEKTKNQEKKAHGEVRGIKGTNERATSGELGFFLGGRCWEFSASQDL